MSSMSRLLFEKHHGLGNDFLIALFDGPEDMPDDDTASGWAQKLCHRRHGVGADGMILATANPAAMRLWNSDGSAAEVSGNGLRCLAHAIARRQNATALDILIATDAGQRRCLVLPVSADDPDARADANPDSDRPDISALPADAVVVAEMGHVGVGSDGPSVLPGSPDPASAVKAAAGIDVSRWGTADVGNPHIVLMAPDPNIVPLASAGPAVEPLFPEGCNVHFAAVKEGADAEAAVIDMRTWERGAGVTDACGTGAVAAAAVLRSWGEVGSCATVRMPGGEADVKLEPLVTLTGPSSHVAAIIVDAENFSQPRLLR